MKTAFITGATSGIGRATATELGKNGFRIIACGRREDRLAELKSELTDITEITTLIFDVRDKTSVSEAVQSLDSNWQKVDVLVNNAGNAHGLSNIKDGSIEDWDAMIDINVKGLLYVTKAVLPLMPKNAGAHIINIGSIAGREVYGNGNVYCASKSAVDALSEGMRIDLNQDGIKVSQIAPGLVETEFSLVRFKGDAKKSEKVYEGYKALQPKDLAELILFMATRPQHVNIADVLILPEAQAASTIVRKS